MSHTILFNKPKLDSGGDYTYDPIVTKISQAARSEGWAGISGFKQWAKETYNATLRPGRYDDWASITFKTEVALNRFKDHFGVDKNS